MPENNVVAMTDAKQPNQLAKQQPGRERLAFVPKDFDDAWRQADVLSKVGIFPDYLKGKPHDILATIITGAELGLSPMQSVRDIVVVKGKGFIQSALKVALVKQSPLCEYFRMVESTDKKAVYETSRVNEGKSRYEYTIEMAQTAGLASNDNYRKNPAAMLRARCSGTLAEIVYSDVTRGIGDKEDLAPETAMSLNAAPRTYAPPAPEMEDAQVVAPTPPQAPSAAQVSEAAAKIPGSDAASGHLAGPAAREPGSDDDVPVEPPAPKSTPPKSQGGEDLAVFAELTAIDPAAPNAEALLDALSPRARAINGPMRKEISDLFIASRKALRTK